MPLMLPWQGGVTAPASSQPKSQLGETLPACGAPSSPRVMQPKVMQVQGRGASVESFFLAGGGRRKIRGFLNL